LKEVVMQGDGNVCLPRDQQFPISKTLIAWWLCVWFVPPN